MTTLLLSALAGITQRGHCCALVDAGDCFDLMSAERAGIAVERLLWVRCRQRSSRKSQSLHERQGREINPQGLDVNSGREINPRGPDVKQLSSTLRQIPSSLREMPSPLRHMPRSAPQILSSASRISSMVEQKVSYGWQLLNSGKQISNANRQMFDQEGKRSSSREHKRQVYSEKVDDGKKKRLSPLEQAFKAADILIQNGGFGLIAVDLRSIEASQLKKVPLTTWFRFVRVAEKTQTALVFLTNVPVAQSCGGLTFHMGVETTSWSSVGTPWPEEVATRPAFDEAASKDVACGSGSYLKAGANWPPSQHPHETSVPSRETAVRKSNNGEVSATQSKSSGGGKRKFIASHTQTLKGAEYEIQIKRGRKPVESSTPKFQTMSKWK